VRIEDRLILTDVLANGSRLHRYRIIGAAAGGRAPIFARQAIRSSRAFVAVRFEPPIKTGSSQRNKSFGIAPPAAAALWASFERLSPLTDRLLGSAARTTSTPRRHRVVDRDLNNFRCAELHGGDCQTSKICPYNYFSPEPVSVSSSS
jgi:hypothetical protein